MIRRFPLFRQSIRTRRAGFTLIELLTVIAIILVLAGLLLNVAGNANYKSSMSRATAEVKAMETSLESYKADNGTYPRVAYSSSSINSDGLNAQQDSDPTDTKYTTSGRVLYQALSGYGTVTGGTTPNKRYMYFKPGQLSTGTVEPTDSTCVIDPFGLKYGYSTINQSAQEGVNNGTNTPAIATSGYNPTFDLWSTGGYSSTGKSYSKTGLATNAYNTLWAKNW